MTPVLGIVASSNQQGRGGGPISSFDALASITVPSGGLATVTFAGIPANYQHLQFRMVVRNTSGNSTGFVTMRFNGDAGNNYGLHQLISFGSGAAPSVSYNGIASFAILERISGGGMTGGVYGGIIADILDYNSPNISKVIRSLGGIDGNTNNTSGSLYENSNFWTSTAPITSVTLGVDTSNIAQDSVISLYGVK
jgi:hypothetical protein